jgi:hypothetical protein
MTLLLLLNHSYEVAFPIVFYSQYQDFQKLTDLEKKKIDDEIILIMCGWLA